MRGGVIEMAGPLELKMCVSKLQSRSGSLNLNKKGFVRVAAPVRVIVPVILLASEIQVVIVAIPVKNGCEVCRILRDSQFFEIPGNGFAAE